MSDEFKHNVEKGLGAAKEGIGKAFGDEDAENEGKKEQVEAEVKGVGDKLKDAAETVKDKLTDN